MTRLELPENNREHLERVSSKIAKRILEFFEYRPAGWQFHMAYLRHCVAAFDGSIAPDSPSRVMRDLRQKGLLNYKVVDRRQSLYEILKLEDGS